MTMNDKTAKLQLLLCELKLEQRHVNNDLSHLYGLWPQEAMYRDLIPEGIKWYGGEANDGRFDMHWRNIIVRDVSRFTTKDERATHRHAIVIKDDDWREKDIAFWDAGCGEGKEHNYLNVPVPPLET